jgi:hypothetical protein
MRMQNESGREVVACALGQEALAERRLRWDALGARAGIDIVASDSGLRLIYRADNEVEQELRELAALERECCAFADWSVRSSDGQVVLDIRGESDVAIAAVQEMFLTETVDVGGRSVDIANARHSRQRQCNSALSRQ